MSLRVLFVTNIWPDDVRPWWGPFVKQQADSLEALGVEVDPLSIRGYAGRGAYFRAVPSVLRLNRKCPYDVVHAHFGHSAMVARLQVRAPLVITYHGSDLLGTPTPSGSSITPRSRLERAVFRRFARFASATITVSEEMEQLLPARCRERNHILPCGIDLERFRPMPRADARRRLGWDPDEKVILFTANPELPRKNFPLAEEVHRQVAAQAPEARLRVAWGLAPDDIPIWMSAADVFLLSSRWEGSPQVAKEAMAAELPLVSTPVGDVEERTRGVAGCWVCPPEPALLADAVLAAFRHGRAPEARRAVTPLANPEIARRIVQIYESVLPSRGRPVTGRDDALIHPTGEAKA